MCCVGSEAYGDNRRIRLFWAWMLVEIILSLELLVTVLFDTKGLARNDLWYHLITEYDPASRLQGKACMALCGVPNHVSTEIHRSL